MSSPPYSPTSRGKRSPYAAPRSPSKRAPGRCSPPPNGRSLRCARKPAGRRSWAPGWPAPALDHTTGVLHRVTGAPRWDGFPLRDALAERLGLPVVLDKDTNAAALGLAHDNDVLSGAGSFGYLHLGTGLGAGLVLGGSLYRGARTGAGEFGHQIVQWDGPICGCGRRGCIEALCLAAVARGDLPGAARALGVGAANLVELLDIDRVLLGGRTVLEHPQAFLGGVAQALDEQAGTRGRAGAGRAVPVALARGGARTVADGAAELVLAPLFGARQS